MLTRLAPIAALFCCLLSCGHAEDGEDGESITGDRGERGEIGPAGVAGQAGQPGTPAQPCTVHQIDTETVVFVCPDGTTATLKSKTQSCGGKKN